MQNDLRFLPHGRTITGWYLDQMFSGNVMGASVLMVTGLVMVGLSVVPVHITHRLVPVLLRFQQLRFVLFFLSTSSGQTMSSVFILRQIPWPTNPSRALVGYAEAVLENLSQNPHMALEFELALEDDIDAREVFDMFSREPPFASEQVFWETLRAEIKVKDDDLLSDARVYHNLKKNIPTPVLDEILYGIDDMRLGLLKFEIQHGMRSLAVLMCCLVVGRFPWLHIPLVKAMSEGMKSSVELATAFISEREAEELLYQRDMNRFDLDAARARSDSLKRAAQERAEQSRALGASLSG